MSREILPPRAEGGRKFAWHPAPPSRLPITLRPSVPLNCRAHHGKPVSRCSFPSYTGWFFRTGPEPLRARRHARRSEPFTARTVLRGLRKRETRRSISEAQQAKRSNARVRLSTIVLFETRGL